MQRHMKGSGSFQSSTSSGWSARLQRHRFLYAKPFNPLKSSRRIHPTITIHLHQGRSLKIKSETFTGDKKWQLFTRGFLAQAKQHWTRKHLTFPQSEWTDARLMFSKSPLFSYTFYGSCITLSQLASIHWTDSMLSDHELVSRTYKNDNFHFTKKPKRMCIYVCHRYPQKKLQLKAGVFIFEIFRKKNKPFHLTWLLRRIKKT